MSKDIDSLLVSYPLTCLLPSEQCSYSQEERYTFSLKNASGVDLNITLTHFEVPHIFHYFLDAEKNPAAGKRACVLQIALIPSKNKIIAILCSRQHVYEQFLIVPYFKEKFFTFLLRDRGANSKMFKSRLRQMV